MGLLVIGLAVTAPATSGLNDEKTAADSSMQLNWPVNRFFIERLKGGIMCKGFDLDENQKEVLKECVAQAQQPNRSRWARFRTGLTMFVVGMHSATSRIPSHYDEKNKLF